MSKANLFVEEKKMCERYRDSVEGLFKLGSTKPISNSKPEHAAILLETIFKHTKNKINILCDSLSKKVFDNEILCAAFKEMIDRKIQINIILQNGMDNSKIKKILLKHKDHDNLNFYDGATDVDFHFTVADGLAFRFENDHDDATAVGCANNQDFASKLDNFFQCLMLDVKPHLIA